MCWHLGRSVWLRDGVIRAIRDRSLGRSRISGPLMKAAQVEKCASGWRWKGGICWATELAGLLREYSKGGGWSLGQMLQLSAMERRDLLTEAKNNQPTKKTQAKETGRHYGDMIFKISKRRRKWYFELLKGVFIWTPFFKLSALTSGTRILFPHTIFEKINLCFDFRIIMIGDFVLLNLSWLWLALWNEEIKIDLKIRYCNANMILLSE